MKNHITLAKAAANAVTPTIEAIEAAETMFNAEPGSWNAALQAYRLCLAVKVDCEYACECIRQEAERNEETREALNAAKAAAERANERMEAFVKRIPGISLHSNTTLTVNEAIDLLEKARSSFECGGLEKATLLKVAEEGLATAERICDGLPDSDPEEEKREGDLRRLAHKVAAIAYGYESPSAGMAAAMEKARLALSRKNAKAAKKAHDMLWNMGGGTMSEEQYTTFVNCEELGA